MNRTEIKENAKTRIKGNLWNILWPVLLIIVIEIVVSYLLNLAMGVTIDFENITDATLTIKGNPVYTLLSILLSIIFSTIMIAYYKYVINFVRTGTFDTNTILNCLKEKWLNLFCIAIVTTLIAEISSFADYIFANSGISGHILNLLSLVFYVLQIILMLGLAMSKFIVVDTDLGPIDCLKKSWEMMKGYKWNCFVFFLSFLGWILLTPFTLFLLLIWLFPYIMVALTMYYEKLRTLK